MLEGLEISEINLIKVLEIETHRLDSDYYKKEYISLLQRVESKKNRFHKFEDFGLKVDASAFYPSLEPYYNSGDVPFLRVADVDTNIDYDGCIRIPKHIIENPDFNTLKVINKGDIVITKGGSIARVGLVEKETAVTRDLIFVNSSLLPDKDYKFLFLYLLSNVSYNLLVRSSSMTAQPHLTIKLVRNLPIFSASSSFKDATVKVYDTATEKLSESRELYHQAEQLLLEELGLLEFESSQESINIKSFQSSFAVSGRLDAEYYQLKFDELKSLIAKRHKLLPLKTFLDVNQRGSQPLYSTKGLPVVNSKHVLEGEVNLSNNRLGSIPSKENPLFIQEGDVLINGTGVGTIGRSAPYLSDKRSIPDNHVTVLRTTALNPVFLSMYLNSVAGKYQVEKYFKGSSGQIELYPKDIESFYIPNIDAKIQTKIAGLAGKSYGLKCESLQLLAVAKRAVETAIEEDEGEALAFIRGELI